MKRRSDLSEKFRAADATVGVIGLGYVGLPLVIAFARAGLRVIGFDIDPAKVKALKAGRSYIKHIGSDSIREIRGKFTSTTDFSELSAVDAVIMCVPTPLNKHREPDMSYVFNTAKTVAARLRRGQLVVLESTTYPGTTDGEVREILESGGLKAGVDFHLAFSPEREDPCRKDFSLETTPKVVGGLTRGCLEAAEALYAKIVAKTVPVSSTRVAEAAKLIENIYRAVNIALVNESKMLFDRMDIDIWEVIEAARTKPFGFEAFYPGPGLGGHCIPIDPFYLTWKAREYDFSTRFIELAGEINTGMPQYVLDRSARFMNARGMTLKGARVLILGVAYKKNVDDQRESPSLRLIELFREAGAVASYSDPHVPVCGGHRHYPDITMKSVKLTPAVLKKTDLVVLATDHEAFDYAFIERHARLIVDTRNAFERHGIRSRKVLKA